MSCRLVLSMPNCVGGGEIIVIDHDTVMTQLNPMCECVVRA